MQERRTFVFWRLASALAIVWPLGLVFADSGKGREVDRSDIESAEQVLSEVAAESQDAVAGETGQSCETVASFVQSFSNPNRLRGNIYEFEHAGVLHSFGIELSFTGPADLCFTMLRREGTEGNFFTVPGWQDLDVSVVGTGRRLWSTSEVGPAFSLPVQQGFQYILAVGWGGTSIGTSRDTLQYPGDFSHGLVLGSISVAIANRCLTLNENGFPAAPFVGGGHLMQLCFEPESGACCCIGEGGCEPILQSNCLARGGYFQGERVACVEGSANRCTCGSCCLPCRGECRNDVERNHCISRFSGEFLGASTQCAGATSGLRGLTDCPVRFGACCSGNDCREVCEPECQTSGDSFLGLGTSCGPPNPCAGACCVMGDDRPLTAGFCVEITEELCTNAVVGGDYRGDETTCASLSLPDECGGACCWGPIATNRNQCAPVASRSDCGGLPNGVYMGDGFPQCPADSCGAALTEFGACCIADVDHNGIRDCFVSTRQFCEGRRDDLGAVYQGNNTSCSQGRCEALPTGACCDQDGSCYVSVRPDCVFFGGRFIGDGTSCVSAACVAPTGACCNAGLCTIKSQAQCAGVYRGDGSICASATDCPQVVGACCFSSGLCSQTTNAACTQATGVFRGTAISCQQAACPQPSGACCRFGLCTSTTEFQCSSSGGTFRGPGEICTPNLCPVARGACCSPNDGSCVFRTELDCENVSHTFRGPGTDCDPNDCPVPPDGACCLADGRCNTLTRFACGQIGGFFQGNNSLCNSANCPLPDGPCCLDNGSCTILTESECTLVEGNWPTPFGDCTPNPCPQPMGACCLDNVCEIKSESDCIAAFGEYVGDNTNCSAGLCTARAPGACCFAEAVCEEITVRQCWLRSGVAHLPGTLCSQGPCPSVLGACCKDGICTENQTRPQCVAAAGVFQGVNTNCSDDPCPEPQGACCRNGTCTVETQGNCLLNSNGAYLGDDTSCTSPSACPARRAACCDDGVCIITTEALCIGAGGQFRTNVLICNGDVNCPVATGACCVNTTCSVLSRPNCATAGGEYRGDGSACANSCVPIAIVSANPPNNAIDARQPSMGLVAQGFDRVTLTFTGPAAGLTVLDFAISTFPPVAAELLPSAASVINVAGNTATVVFNKPAPAQDVGAGVAGVWTRITHIPSGTSTCLGFLPADVDGSRRTSALDIIRLINCLNGTQTCASYQGDLNRSGEANAQDILRTIDLLNGAGGTTVWNDKSLAASPCAP